MTVADRIRGYMAEHKISNIELSKKTGIDQTALSKTLNNQRKMDVNEFILIIDAFGEPADTFIRPRTA